MDDTRHQIVGEVLPVLLPDAGAPFADLLPAAREVLFQRAPRSQYELSFYVSTGNSISLVSEVSGKLSDVMVNPTQMIALASLVLLFLAETLLRFRFVLALEPPEVMMASTVKPGGRRLRRFAALSPFIDSARMGLRYFGVITLHIWLLRLAGAALMLLFVALPMAASTQVMLPALISFTGKTPLLPAWHFIQSSLAAFVAALVLTFSTIYDARLFVALQSDVE
jgi:hypothetical protein